MPDLAPPVKTTIPMLPSKAIMYREILKFGQTSILQIDTCLAPTKQIVYAVVDPMKTWYDVLNNEFSI